MLVLSISNGIQVENPADAPSYNLKFERHNHMAYVGNQQGEEAST
jgi:hypothetical protein